MFRASGIKKWAQRLKKDLTLLYVIYIDPRTPWYVKSIAIFVFIYAASPIDLIPDFIPIIGYLDDLIIVPFGIWLSLKMIPQELLNELRQEAEKEIKVGIRIKLGGLLIVLFLWALLLRWILS